MLFERIELCAIHDEHPEVGFGSLDGQLHKSTDPDLLGVAEGREGGAWGTCSDTKGERCGSSWSGAAVERAVGLCARVSKLAGPVAGASDRRSAASLRRRRRAGWRARLGRVGMARRCPPLAPAPPGKAATRSLLARAVSCSSSRCRDEPNGDQGGAGAPPGGRPLHHGCDHPTSRTPERKPTGSDKPRTQTSSWCPRPVTTRNRNDQTSRLTPSWDFSRR